LDNDFGIDARIACCSFERCTPFLRDSPTVSVEKWSALGNPDKGGPGKKTLEKLC
jgi:hypothetical protein